MLEELKRQWQVLEAKAPNLYEFLNQYRDWFNRTVANYEFFLEDNWFEDKTTIDYCIRSLESLDFVVFAEDTYENSRDTKTWHLGNYVSTRWTQEHPWEVIEQFILANPPPKPKTTDNK